MTWPAPSPPWNRAFPIPAHRAPSGAAWLPILFYKPGGATAVRGRAV